MDRATDKLVQAFGEDEEIFARTREKAVIAAVLVGQNCVPTEDNGISVSSFVWAMPLAIKKRFDRLGAWLKTEPKVIEQLDDILRRVDDMGAALPLDLPTIQQARQWLVEQFALRSELFEAPTFALRVYHYFKAKRPPEAMLLNSFFLGDLARGASLVEKGRAPVGLRKYLGIEKPAQTSDLLTDRLSLEKAVAPEMMPGARWPSRSPIDPKLWWSSGSSEVRAPRNEVGYQLDRHVRDPMPTAMVHLSYRASQSRPRPVDADRRNDSVKFGAHVVHAKD